MIRALVRTCAAGTFARMDDFRSASASRCFSRPSVAFAIAVLLIHALAACSPPAPTEHAGQGKTIEIDPAARTITLEHGELPGLMQAMTMTFAVAPEVDLARVGEGAEVDFRVRSEGSTITVIALEPRAQTH